MVEYAYDAWGKLLATTGTLAATIGLHNPLRYRGYVYDNESSHYYLQSRYYDPELGRFINADAFTSTGQGILGNNMFAYCLNNPVTHADAGGNLPRGIVNPNAMTHNGGSIRPISDKDREEAASKHKNRQGTLLAGLSLSAFGGGGGSVTVGVAFDTKWNIGFVITPAFGGGFPAGGVVGVCGITNAPTIFELAGWSEQVGGSVNAYGGSIGAEASFFSNPQNGASYQGFALMLGAKAAWPVELHGTAGYSYVFGCNMFDALINLTRAICYC